MASSVGANASDIIESLYESTLEMDLAFEKPFRCDDALHSG